MLKQLSKVYETVTRLNELLEKKIGVEDAKAVIRGLRRVDSVLQVFF